MKLLQVCNVGRIVGGTAACAWSITRAFPDVEHHVAFLSSISSDTTAAFAGVRLHRCDRVTAPFVREVGCDAVILHNTSASRAEPITSAWTLQYVHSQGTRAAADLTRYCSRWLAERCLADQATDEHVLYQCVPRPVGQGRLASPNRELFVGRICTPSLAKWPPSLIGFYSTLASAHPTVRWEFVGCPSSLVPALAAACNNRATFHAAGWQARAHLTRWDAVLYQHPSITETFGRTAAEAMRAGCVPIVDARGGFLEQVTPESGYLCRSAEDFCRALDQLRNSRRRHALSAVAVQRGDGMFSMAAFRERLRRLWRCAAHGYAT